MHVRFSAKIPERLCKYFEGCVMLQFGEAEFKVPAESLSINK